MTSICLKMEDEIRKTTSIFLKMEDDLNILKMEADPILFENGRQPYFCCGKMQPKTLKIKTMVVAPLRVT